jgi:hypothetical protein
MQYKITPQSIESLMIKNYKAGQSFLSFKDDKHLQAFASYHGKKIKTERLIAINCNNKELQNFKLTTNEQ